MYNREFMAAAFAPFFFRMIYLLLFVFGAVAAPILTGTMGVGFFLLCVFILLPLLLLSAIFAGIAALVNAVKGIRARGPQNNSAILGTFLFPILAGLFTILGFIVALAAQSAYFAGKISRNFGAVHHGAIIMDENFQLISAEPEIAAYVIGHWPGFAAPGFTHYFILDRGGQIGARPLHFRIIHAGPIALRFGPYLYAAVYDTDG